MSLVNFKKRKVVSINLFFYLQDKLETYKKHLRRQEFGLLQYLWITEGYFDTLALLSIGIPSVSVGGTFLKSLLPIKYDKLIITPDKNMLTRWRDDISQSSSVYGFSTADILIADPSSYGDGCKDINDSIIKHNLTNNKDSRVYLLTRLRLKEINSNKGDITYDKDITW